MATADELLMAAAANTTGESSEAVTNEEILVADLNTQVIDIPAGLRILGVESDDDVKRLQFRIPRYYGEFDLSTFDIRVNFENAKGKGDVYPVNDVVVSDSDRITFSWLVDRIAFNYPGDVKFSLCLKLYDGEVVVKELNTTYATLPVLEGLETEKAVVDQNPSAFDQVMCRLYAVEAATGNGKNGYYSVVKVTQRDDGTVFTIVNQDGETVAYVRHGTDGEDGYTPVKGVDYWTTADETDIKQDVRNHAENYVNQWAPRPASVTLAPGAAWSNNKQTVNAEGVTEDNIVIVSPNPNGNNRVYYINNGIRCISQSDKELTFECDVVPQNEIVVNIGIFYSADTVESTMNSIIVSDDGEGNVVIM